MGFRYLWHEQLIENVSAHDLLAFLNLHACVYAAVQVVKLYKASIQQTLDILFLRGGVEFITSSDCVSRDSADRTLIAWDFQTTAKLSNQIYHVRISFSIPLKCLYKVIEVFLQYIPEKVGFETDWVMSLVKPLRSAEPTVCFMMCDTWPTCFKRGFVNCCGFWHWKNSLESESLCTFFVG